MVELEINGKSLELNKSGSDISYTMQIADIFDIANVSASYTNSFSIPKTANNTQIFKQLGIVGDSSQMPYQKVPVKLKNYGFDVIKEGWLNIKDTTDTYNVNIIDGMIDFFKAIDNKTIGVDLDLSEFSHEKTVERVIQSFDFSEVNLKYIVADYNGKNLGSVTNDSGSFAGINIDYLVPCFYVKRLLDIIFQTYGYTYNDENFEFLEGLYITYPLAPAASREQNLVGTLTKTDYISSDFQIRRGRKYIYSQAFWSTTDVEPNNLIPTNIQNLVYVGQSGTYTVSGTVEAYGTFLSNTPVPITFDIYLDGNLVGHFNTDPLAPVDYSFQFDIQAGQYVEFFLSAPNVNTITAIHHNLTTINFYKDTLGQISANDAFKDFKIKDFFKELLWRSGLTPVIDVLSNNIYFYPISYRLDKTKALEWTNKFVSREKESYINNSYAQKNTFRLQHNKEGDLFGNGYLYVNNENIQDEKTLVDSKIYAPEIGDFFFSSLNEGAGFSTNKYRIWDREVKESQTDGTTEIDYKGLSNRFYFLRFERYETRPFNLVSETLNQASFWSGRIPYANNINTLFSELIFSNYLDYNAVLTNFRAYNFSLKLGLSDILGLNMLVPYYFKQEAAYFLLNKLTYKDGEISSGEFVKINNIN